MRHLPSIEFTFADTYRRMYLRFSVFYRQLNLPTFFTYCQMDLHTSCTYRRLYLPLLALTIKVLRFLVFTVNWIYPIFAITVKWICILALTLTLERIFPSSHLLLNKSAHYLYLPSLMTHNASTYRRPQLLWQKLIVGCLQLLPFFRRIYLSLVTPSKCIYQS